MKRQKGGEGNDYYLHTDNKVSSKFVANLAMLCGATEGLHNNHI